MFEDGVHDDAKVQSLPTTHHGQTHAPIYGEDGEQRTVFAFSYGETVHQIAGRDDVSVEGLTESGTFKSMTLLKDEDIIKEVNK